MRRVVVIGNGGSGKSTFATALGARLDLEVIYLDRLYWRPSWSPIPGDEWRSLQEALVRSDSWVIDGNYTSTLEIRLAAADTIFFFDVPTWLSLFGVLKRWARNYGKAVQAEGCPEHVSWSFLCWVWRFRRDSRPRVLAKIRTHAAGAELTVIRSRRDAKHALLATPIGPRVETLAADA